MGTKNFQLLFVGPLGLLAVEPFLGGAPRSGAWLQLAYTSGVVVGAFGVTEDRRAFYLAVGLCVVSGLDPPGRSDGRVRSGTPLRRWGRRT